MEQAIIKTGRHAGWSENEDKLLWETADAAQQQGMPLKAVFDRIARETGRRPNSIRNYYYAQVRDRGEDARPGARFVPFTQEEVDQLMRRVLTARAAGQSVRSCLQQLAQGDHSLMLRYQNKYRAIIKTRPDYVRELVDQLNGEGVECDTPQVNHRAKYDLAASCRSLTGEGHRSGDPELARACDVLTKYLQTRRTEMEAADLTAAVTELVAPMKDFLAMTSDQRTDAMEDFCRDMSGRIGEIEALLTGDHAADAKA